VQRVYPSPAAPTTAADAYGVSRPLGPGGRPWIGVCMVASIDGSTQLGGKSAGLSSAADRDVMLTLRLCADLIIVGAGTVRAEQYGVPRKPGQRIGVVSRTGNVDLNTPLFTSGSGFLILPEDAPASPAECVRAGRGELDLALALRLLPSQPRFVHVEGGPSLNGALAAADLVDELNITTSPQIVGGDGARLIDAAPALQARFQLAHVLEDDSFLFSRYVRDKHADHADHVDAANQV
jgi:riboflavin biosynthesis pyrimidine reductase